MPHPRRLQAAIPPDKNNLTSLMTIESKKIVLPAYKWSINCRLAAVTGSDLPESLALEIIVSSDLFDNHAKYGISLGLNKYFRNNSR